MALWNDRKGLELYQTENKDYYYLKVKKELIPYIKPFITLKHIGGIASQDGFHLPSTIFPFINYFLAAFHLSKLDKILPPVEPRDPEHAYTHALTTNELSLLSLLQPDKTLFGDKARASFSMYKELSEAKTDEEYNKIKWDDIEQENNIENAGMNKPNYIIIEYLTNKGEDFKYGDEYATELLDDRSYFLDEDQWVLHGDTNVIPDVFTVPEFPPDYWGDDKTIRFNPKYPYMTTDFDISPSMIPTHLGSFGKAEEFKIVTVNVYLSKPSDKSKETQFPIYFINDTTKPTHEIIAKRFESSDGFIAVSGSDDKIGSYLIVYIPGYELRQAPPQIGADLSGGIFRPQLGSPRLGPSEVPQLGSPRRGLPIQGINIFSLQGSGLPQLRASPQRGSMPAYDLNPASPPVTPPRQFAQSPRP